jgi:transmembrane sensor
MHRIFSRRPRTAAQWVARFHSGHWQATDERAFSAWLRQDPRHRAQFELLSRLDTLSAGLAASPTVRADLARSTAMAKSKAAGAPMRRGLLMASLAMAAVAGVMVWPDADLHSTEIGQTSTLNLPDGSVLWLNTDSQVRLRFRDGQRLVKLERGQAFFKVQRDPEHPFVVDAGSRRVVVTGTQFDVRRDGSEVAVAVLEGHVQVSPSGGATASEPMVALAARQDARFSAHAAPKLLADAHVERHAAWREGRIILDNTTLEAALLEFNRYLKTPLALADANTAHLTITGEFRTGDADSVLFALRELYGLRARHEARRIVLEKADN